MGLKAAAQALKKAELLKDKVQQCKDLLNDNDAWVCQQQLQKIYQKVLILDLEYALDRKVEQELWNLGFKNYIATLQSQAKDRRNPKRGESQAMLSWCLEAASGFYLTLLQEICTAFDLDLPFRRKGYVYGCTSPWKAVEKLSAPHKSSCFYACQYCLVHLGDIARYRNQNKQAELFYRHAVSLSPSSGQPYNQLALLEASRDDKLSTVFLYVRSVAVKHPFQVATTNLAKTLSTALNDHTFNLEKHEKDGSKLTSQEYIIVFLKFHAVLHNLGDLNVATSYVKILTESLTALIATESFTSWKLVQMLVINLFALQHHCATGNKDEISFDEQQLSVDEKIARDSILDLIAGSLSALLLPVYTIKSSIVDYFALPSIKLCLDWIVSRKGKVLEQVAFTSRLQIWPSLCVLLNALQDCVVEFKHEQHIKTPLPEDCNLQGFLPLEKTFENLRFTNTELEGDTTTVNKLRAVRIIQLGHQIAQYRLNDANSSVLISIITDEKNEVEKKFVAMSGDVGPSNELMKELEELSLNKEKHGSIANSESPVPSESTSSKASSEPDPENLLEKKVGGILKPQGSLERNRNEIPTLNMETVPQESATPALSTPAFSTTRKARQNVAMQAIMRRAEAEQKQVTFKNLSPPVIPEEEESNDEKKIIANSTIALATNGTQASSTALPNKIPTQISVAQQQRPTIPTLSNNSTMNLQGLIKQGLNSNQMNSSSAASGQLFASPPSVEHEMLPYRQLQNCIYPPQTSGFNAQNPQFAKNFLSSQPQTQRYQQQTQRQFPSMNSIGTRALHARNFNQEGANSISQKSNDSKVNLQSGNTFNQGIISNLALNPNNGNAGRLLPNDMAQNLSLIQQNYQQQRINQNNAATLSPNSFQMTPTNMANFKINNFPQNYSSQQEKILISPSSAVATAAAPAAATAATNYPRNSVGQFNNSFNGQQSNSLNYAIFPNYESGDFNLWKDTQQQPPQPPITWWGNTNTTGTQQIRGTPLENRSQIRPNNEWGSNSRPGGVGTAITGGVGGVNINAGNSFQNTIHRQQHFRNSFDDVGLRFEVDQQQQLQPKPQTLQSTNTYSLFSGGANTWGNNCGNSSSQTSNVTQEQLKNRLSQQSLWSGPGPSPLERLLEQQKSLREGGT